MTRDRSQVIGTALAVAWLVGFTMIDLFATGHVVLSPLFALAPIFAAAVLPAAPTALFAALAVVLSIASGFWSNAWDDPQQTVRVVDVTLVSFVAVIVAAVRVRREQRHERVSEIAEVAQRTVLPVLPKRVRDVGIAVRYVSAAEDTVVGGDLYDCYYSDRQMRFLVGDVCGKGIAAVEHAARVIRAYRQAAATQETLAAVAEEMDEYLARFFDDEEFVTACLVDTTEPDKLTVVSCGHPPAMLVRADGSMKLLEAPTGLPLGLGGGYDEQTYPWHSGDRLLMYTDGLSEARDQRGEFLPLPPLRWVVSADGLDDALDHLLEAVRRHVPAGRMQDDLAVVLLENILADDRQPVEPGVEAATRTPPRPLTAVPQQANRGLARAAVPPVSEAELVAPSAAESAEQV